MVTAICRDDQLSVIRMRFSTAITTKRSSRLPSVARLTVGILGSRLGPVSCIVHDLTVHFEVSTPVPTTPVVSCQHHAQEQVVAVQCARYLPLPTVPKPLDRRSDGLV